MVDLFTFGLFCHLVDHLQQLQLFILSVNACNTLSFDFSLSMSLKTYFRH